MRKLGFIPVGVVTVLSLAGCSSSTKAKTSSAATGVGSTAAPVVAGPQTSSAGGLVPATLPPTTATTRPPTTAAPTTAAGPTVVFQKTGSGSATTESFGVKDEWALGWNYDCSKFGNSGNFIVQISQPPGKVGVNVLSHDQGVNQLGASGASVEHYHYGGTIYLQVISECSWSIKVTD